MKPAEPQRQRRFGRQIEGLNELPDVLHQVFPLGGDNQRIRQLVHTDRQLPLESYLGFILVVCSSGIPVNVDVLRTLVLLLLLISLQCLVRGAQ